eukprot:scaffold78995_cov48-Attheya_sp.AAC.2
MTVITRATPAAAAVPVQCNTAADNYSASYFKLPPRTDFSVLVLRRESWPTFHSSFSARIERLSI